jgi:hypothetical protein
MQLKKMIGLLDGEIKKNSIKKFKKLGQTRST